MADNVNFQTNQRAWPPDGMSVKTEQQVGGEHRQVIAVRNPEDGTALEVTSVQSIVSDCNSSIVSLGSGATFTGDWRECLDYANISIAVTSNVASATNGLVLQWSMDGVTVDDTDSFSILANAKKQFTFGVTHKYFRVLYTNGVTPQTTFRLQTILHVNAPKPSSHRIQDNIVDEDDAELVESVLKLRTAANTYVSGAATNSGNFKVSVEEVESGVVIPVTEATLDALVENRTQTPTKPKALNVQIGPGDPISNVPVVIEYDHHQVHEGESHGYSNLTASLASGSIKDFRINVPAALDTIGEAPHMVFEVITTLEAEAYIYEGMTYTVGNGGTERTTYNRNRISSTIVAATKVYEDPTPATTGTNLWIGLTGSANRAGSSGRSLTEWVLKPGDYLFRITSRAAGNKVLVRFEWYEDLGV